MRTAARAAALVAALGLCRAPEPDASLLVAFVGLQRTWEATWRSQRALLGERAWASIACVGAGEAGPSAEIVEGLRIREVVRPRLAPWYPNARADVEATARCEHGDATATAASGGGGVSQHVHDMCLLRRTSACSAAVLDACARGSCAAVLLLRPDVLIVEPRAAALDEALASTLALGARAPVRARFRCVGFGEPARTRGFPARLCDGKDGREPCPTRRFTLDDMIVLAPRPHARSVFRTRYLKPSARTLACPATARWPEGVLTHSLLMNATPVEELSGVQTSLVRDYDARLAHPAGQHHAACVANGSDASYSVETIDFPRSLAPHEADRRRALRSGPGQNFFRKIGMAKQKRGGPAQPLDDDATHAARARTASAQHARGSRAPPPRAVPPAPLCPPGYRIARRT